CIRANRPERYRSNVHLRSTLSSYRPVAQLLSLGHMSTSRTGITISALLGVLMLALFYSLALHMHQSLGGWPTSIGERGFSPALVAHSWIAMNVFILLFFSLFGLPIPILICS